MEYRRFHVPGSTVFLTWVTHQRQPVLLHPPIREALRLAMAHVATRHPFNLSAFVVLPDHCHLMWRLPVDDGNFSRRVRLVKHHMARQICVPKPLWQGRYWDHVIRDDEDWRRHLDYIHFNPVKHGHAARAADWVDSSFSHYVERGIYDTTWGEAIDIEEGGE